MDTKTNKDEALYILSVIERGSDDAEFMGNARRHFYTLMKARGCDRRDYLDSVDACLTLILPPGLRWRLNPEVPGTDIEARVLFTHTISSHQPGTYHEAKTLPLAMLKAWWVAQPE